MAITSFDKKNNVSFTVDTDDYAIISKKNGNIVIDSPDLSAVLKQAYGQKAFWKLYMADYIQIILGVMDYKQLDVFMYISMNTRASDNVFIGTYDKIAEGVNPKIVMKGGIAKKNLLISYYDSEQINVPLPKALPAAEGKSFEEELEAEGQQTLALEELE